MHPYLQSTEFATKNLFALATEEGRRLKELLGELRSAESLLKINQWDFQTSDLNDDFSDAYAMAAFQRAAKSHQEVERLKQEVENLEASVRAHEYAVQTISGAILQIAKQGISVVHGLRASAHPGRTVGSLVVRDIIWQARNQAMHYEEGKPNDHVKALFATLEREQGAQFSLIVHEKQNRAKQVLDLLGWESYEAYLHDMQTLLP